LAAWLSDRILPGRVHCHLHSCIDHVIEQENPACLSIFQLQFIFGLDGNKIASLEIRS
jgi:hypothetical protein